MAKFGSNSKPEGAPLTPAEQQRLEQVHRLSRLAGQIGGISRMIEEGRSPEDILTQIKAVRSALNAVEEKVVQSSLREGIERALELPDRFAARLELEKLMGLGTESVRISKAPLSPEAF